MRKELVLIFRFFCLDKNLIVDLLKGEDGSIADAGRAVFREPDVHSMMQQALASVQDWLHELSTLHTENLSLNKQLSQIHLHSEQLKNKNRSLEKTISLLSDSLQLVQSTNEALLDPIRFEMAYITSLQQLDAEIQQARDNFSQQLDLDRVEQIMQGLQRETKSVSIAHLLTSRQMASRLDEIRNDLQKFVVDTRAAMRSEEVQVTHGVSDATVRSKQETGEGGEDEEGISKTEKVARLLSTRYGRTCFDVIIAKTPNTACVHEVQLKSLQDQTKL